jgi:hypothetical protein
MSTNTNTNTNFKKIFTNKKSISIEEVNNKSNIVKILLNTFSTFFTNVNDKVFKDNGKNTEGSELKKEVKIYLTIFLTIFLTLFFIFTITTSIVTIQYYDEICSNNKIVKDDMTNIYRLALLNIILIIIFIGLLISLYLFSKELISENIINKINDWKIIYLVGSLITIINMVISSKFMIIISKCNFETYKLYYYMWINHGIILPICLLILIFNIFYNKIK